MKSIRFISILTALVFFMSAFSSCESSAPKGSSTSKTDLSPSPSESPSIESESLKDSPSQGTSLAPSPSPSNALSEDEQYLASVSYRHYELTGEDTPYFMGRWFKTKVNGEFHMVTTNSGSMLYFMVKGATSMEVNFTHHSGEHVAFYAYSIDGKTPVRKNINDPTVPLPDEGRHTVRIITEGVHEHVGKWSNEKGYAFKNVVPSKGGEILGIKPTEKIIFFYGDSITEGINAIGATGYGESHSATNAYPWYCSEKLGTVLYNIGYGATGLINTGSFNTMINAIDRMANKRYVTTDITPDVIVINHGHNDQYYSSDAMEAALKKTITHLKEKYPEVTIVYMIPFNQAHAKTITEYMAGVENSYVVTTKGWSISMTEGVHPNKAGAKYAGERLAEELLTIFGEEYFD